MPREKMFHKGDSIKTIDELLQCRTDGTAYVFYRDKPLAFSFIGHMNFFTVMDGITRGMFSKAIRN